MRESNQTFMKLKKKKLRNRCLTNRRVESKTKVKHQNLIKKTYNFVRNLSIHKKQTLVHIDFRHSGDAFLADCHSHLSTSYADCERGFSAMKCIIADIRIMISRSKAEKQLFVSTV